MSRLFSIRLLLPIILLATQLGYAQNNYGRHPLSPLSKEELTASSDLLKREGLLGNGYFVQLLTLKEPPKEKVFAGADTPRLAYAVVMNPQQRKSLELVINLDTKSIVKRSSITKSQPAAMVEEYDLVDKLVRTDSRFIKAITKRGLKVEDIYIETWGPGSLEDINVDKKNRYMRATIFYRGKSTNPYSQPLEGLNAVIDVTNNKVVEVFDTAHVPMQPETKDFFKEDWISTLFVNNARFAVNPLLINQPGGKNFTAIDNEVNWQGWRFHYRVDAREGLVISAVGRTDTGKFRPILYRAAMSEMVVPYGDPDRQWYWRSAFDQGDYGLGILGTPLQQGPHFPEGAVVQNLDYVDNSGQLQVLKNAVAIYERDGGVLWSHFDTDSGKVAARRSIELVVTALFTVGNYDYGTEVIFKQDGTIEFRVLPTGVVLTKGTTLTGCERCSSAVSEDGSQRLSLGDKFGLLVDKNLLAVVHQHFFNFRLDFAVDGVENSVAEISVKSLTKSQGDNYNNGYYIDEKVLKTEASAVRDVNSKEARRWWVFNPNVKNKLGHFSGYMIEPLTNSTLMAKPESDVYKLAKFLTHQFWVTRFSDREMNAAGSFPSQGEGDGLPYWVQPNASIENTDLVVWYNFGLTHIPSAEDWPIMSTARAGFMLKPMGFFEYNPALLVPN